MYLTIIEGSPIFRTTGMVIDDLYIFDDYGKTLQQIELATVKYTRENSSYGSYYLKVEA